MFKRLCIGAAAVLSLVAMGISWVANTRYTERRDDLSRAASGITETCSPLREEAFRYEEAKRNALAAYDAELGHLRSPGRGRNLNFRRLLAGTSADSFARAAEEFATALAACEGSLAGHAARLPGAGGEKGEDAEPRDDPEPRTEAGRAALKLAELLLGGAAAVPDTPEARDLAQLERIDREVVARSGDALRAAASARDRALREALELSSRIASLGSLALLFQLLATGCVMAKDVAG